ncbi:MAG: preprotein translocase subunit YajC, partial [Alphaproteobacteria bacterium]|nr:preprotein translocase subunit YajC [Alphaproteobacteria bacterium]
MFISPAFAQAAGAASGGGSMLTQLMPLVLIFAVFYFLLIRPQQKKVKEHRAMVEALRRGDQVVTQCGLVGKVTKVKEGENEIE